jgi:glycosyltransferase involved in cell wall biosynthesis
VKGTKEQMSVIVVEPSTKGRSPSTPDPATTLAALAHIAPAPAALPSGRQRRVQGVSNRVRRDGKFFRLGSEKFYVKGVTYGPFDLDRTGHPLPSRDQVEQDFRQMIALGANCVRIYHIPPKWFLDLAEVCGLKIFLDVAWPKNISFDANPEVIDAAHTAVRTAARQCGNHPAIFAISVVNEFPADLVRFIGREKVERLIDELVRIVKAEAPDCLVTFANYPTTEYLRPREPDFACFNVYLHNEQVFRNYLARLQNIAGDKPLMLGEYGIDTFREYSEDKQAEILTAHVKAVFEEGLVGTFIFSFTDDWVTQGYRIEDWKFGLTRVDRSSKPAFAAVQAIFQKVPQTFDQTLPAMSVIICSYNGASTVESCLRSMERIRYPDFEVIFVDDGSKDNTQEILKRFPWVRNIHQENKGLSYARNVGMNAARGEIIVYTDSDCEADEDWLYYLAVAMKRGGHAGMGGPNLIPDEGSWVADCVGLSPGGPTHVMIDDRTAEHVPGCNMAYYTALAKQINGFDSQYRKAGDDVDFIWRLQNLGYTIGFAPAALVWHYRRNTVQAYLKQQRGYGEAEALLKYKHPDRFNSLGASHWRGRIYGGDEIGVRVGRDVIYHGMFGTGLFQTIYRRPASMLAMMLMSVEWHLLAAFVTMLGLAFTPLLYVAVLMFLTPVVLAMVAAAQAPMPKHRHWLTRPLIAFLHFRQPIARGWARYSVRLKNKVMDTEARGYKRTNELPFDPHDRRTLRYWSTDQDRIHLLQQITEEVKAAGWRKRLDSGWGGWDMEIYGSRYVKVRLTTATEHHNGQGLLTRVCVQTFMSKFCQCLFFASLILCGLLLLHVWPFSRTAVLIPLAWWAMFLVNRRRVAIPVLGLIDAVAEKAGYWPIPAEPKAAAPVAEPAKKPMISDEELEEHEPSVV